MSNKQASNSGKITMADVFTALCEVEKDYHVHCHYVVRRDASVESKRFGYVTLFARRLGVGDEGRTVAKNTEHVPSAYNGSLESVLFRMVFRLANDLDALAKQEELAKQERLFPTAE